MTSSNTGNGRRACATLVTARSNTGSGFHLVNLYAEPLGNPEPPEKFRQIAPPAPTPPPVVKPRRIPWHEVVIVVVLLAAGAGYFLFYRAGPKGTAVPQKSIAVLPMVNSTGD